MGHTIFSVEPGSIADQLGILPGDALLSIGGEQIIDWIDYQALCCAGHIRLLTERSGEQLEYDFEKDPYEPLGLTFGDTLMSGVRNCANRCIFCFVDQLPACARPSMRVKDDDWRLSLMMGNFITLTNVGDRELERIIRRNATPLYISVHATDGDLRAQLLGSPRGRLLMDQLARLARGGISFHLQAVLVPGFNDGAALEKTIADLAALMPAALSLALVPVGLTGHREGLRPIQPFDAAGARAVLEQVDDWQKRLLKAHGARFVYAADEFYLMAGRPFPQDEAYEDYPQIDNGVGLCRLLWTEFEAAFEDADIARAIPARVALATGVSVAPFMQKLLNAHPIKGVEARVYPVTNRFFGPSVTVSGLIAGADLIEQLRPVEADRILITRCMLRDGEDVFLDGVTLEEARRALGRPVVPVERTGEALLNALCGAEVAFMP